MHSGYLRGVGVASLAVAGLMVSAVTFGGDNETIEGHKKGCDAGKAIDCHQLGLRHAGGVGVKRDEALSTAYYRKARDLSQKDCDRGDAEGCVGLGMHYQEGLGVPRDLARAIAIYQGPCDRESAGACFWLGTALALRREGGDMARALAAYGRSCDLGGTLSCVRLAGLYEEGLADEVARRTGTVVPKDPARAAAFHRKACDQGDIPSCARLGQPRP